MKIEGLIPGRIVHYVLSDGSCRPGMVLRVWSSENGCSNLAVFRDGSNDDAVLCARAGDTVPHTGCSISGHQHPAGWPLTFWATSIFFSEQRTHHTWHWPSGCDDGLSAAD